MEADSRSYACGYGFMRRILRLYVPESSRICLRGARVCSTLSSVATWCKELLKRIIAENVPHEGIQWLLSQVIESFSSIKPGVGLPLGNLTSQLFVNIYMNEFDQFVKHRLVATHYIRYADDFVILSGDKAHLESNISPIRRFLLDTLKLELHPEKVFIKTFASGVDFLGWVHFPDHRVLRTATKKRMMKKINLFPKRESLTSYVGLLREGNTEKLRAKILNIRPDLT